MVELLRDPTRTALHLITLPEEMPVNEVGELKDQIETKMQIPIGALLVNGVYPELFADDEVVDLERLRTAIKPDGAVLDRLVEASRFRVDRCRLQRQYIDQLARDFDNPMIEIPFVFNELTTESLALIADRCAGSSA